MSDFRPTLFLKHRCPFCLRLVVYLTEARLLDRFRLDVFEAGSEDEARIKHLLAPRFERVTFPTAEVAPGEYANGTDALIARYAAESGVAPEGLPLLTYYSTGVFLEMQALFRENQRLAAKAG